MGGPAWQDGCKIQIKINPTQVCDVIVHPVQCTYSLEWQRNEPVEEEHLAVVPAAVGLGDVGDVEAGEAEVGAGRGERVDLGHAPSVVLVRVSRVVVVPGGKE